MGSTIFVRQGVRVGVIGLTTEDLPKITFPENVAGLRIEHLVDSTRREIDSLRGQADLFIALAHVGPDEGGSLLESVPELTAVVAGHQHSGWPPKRVGTGMVVGVPAYGLALGRLTLYWSQESHRVSAMDWEKFRSSTSRLTRWSRNSSSNGKARLGKSLTSKLVFAHENSPTSK